MDTEFKRGQIWKVGVEGDKIVIRDVLMGTDFLLLVLIEDYKGFDRTWLPEYAVRSFYRQMELVGQREMDPE
jgi:hypothetical protein